MTIAQIVYDNELHFGYSHDEIRQKVADFAIFRVPRVSLTLPIDSL